MPRAKRQRRPESGSGKPAPEPERELEAEGVAARTERQRKRNGKRKRGEPHDVGDAGKDRGELGRHAAGAEGGVGEGSARTKRKGIEHKSVVEAREAEEGGIDRRRKNNKAKHGTQEKVNGMAMLAAGDGGHDGQVVVATTAVEGDTAAGVDAHVGTQEGVQTTEKGGFVPGFCFERIAVSGGGAPSEMLRLGDVEPPISDVLQCNLNAQGIDRLFPIQVETWRAVLPRAPSRDVWVSSPTGSGKTLAYVIPLLELLQRRFVRRLRALVVVPTRDLAVQVKDVFEQQAVNTGVCVELAVGQSSFAAEQRRFVQRAGALELYSSLIDVLVCTPGRLVDHLEGTPGFTLQHLEFLVIDEADRLLSQSYEHWLQRVHDAAHSAQPGGLLRLPLDATRAGTGVLRFDAGTVRPHGLPSLAPPLQRLLFTATATRNPEQISALHLRIPALFLSTSNAKYSRAASMQDLVVPCSEGERPLVLLALLAAPALAFPRQTLVFARSLQAAHRLARLLELWGDVGVAEFSSALPQIRRSQVLEAFRAGRTRVLVASDAMARGMDVAGIYAVVNYDVPMRLRTYMHRTGRTARAGRSGVAYTLLRPGEMSRLRATVRKAEGVRLKQHYVDRSALEPLIPRYQRCLAALRETVQAELTGKLSPLDAASVDVPSSEGESLLAGVPSQLHGAEEFIDQPEEEVDRAHEHTPGVAR